MIGTTRRSLALVSTAAVLAGSLVATAGPASAAQTIGYPTFTGPAIEQPPVITMTGSMMQAIYYAEKSGTDFWMDRLLARSGGSDPSDADGGILMTRGRALFITVHAGTIGLDSPDPGEGTTVTVTLPARSSS
ncbi:MAG: hypothetical protein JXA67_17340 [Micromonosporaceae bacterium]|nr:hypothetical protein [Micromonosporaceae bacterium]